MRKKILLVAGVTLLLSQQIFIFGHIAKDRKEYRKAIATVYIDKEEEKIEEDLELMKLTRAVINENSFSLSTKDNSIKINSTDYIILCKIASAEAGSNNPEEMKNVVTVILNRINNKNFTLDKDVESTVFRDWQFSPIRDGAYGKAKVNETVKEAVKEAVEDYSIEENRVHGATHFANLSICNPAWQYEMNFLFTDAIGHSFFK